MMNQIGSIAITRRSFFAISLGAAAGGLFGGCHFAPERRGTLLSGFEDARGEQFVGGVSLETGEIFGAPVSMRAHGCAIHPKDPSRAFFFARRPGTVCFELNLLTRQARSIFETPGGRHLSGHGVFSAAGDVLYTPEHDYENAKGVIAVRDMRTFEILGEIDTQGIDPHEIAWLPGKQRLLVANGGILTHPRSFRAKLNIPTMDPSLCVIDARSGECLEQWRLPDHLLSIRHLSVASDGTAAVGLQYEGDRASAPCVVSLYEPGKGLRLLSCSPQAREKFAGYVASVCLSEAEDLITASCPYGSGVACWSKRTGEFLSFVPAAEVYGLSRLADGEVLASMRDGQAFSIDKAGLQSQFVKLVSVEPIRWDDHWVAVT
jgi:uncharacterized protein